METLVEEHEAVRVGSGNRGAQLKSDGAHGSLLEDAVRRQYRSSVAVRRVVLGRLSAALSENLLQLRNAMILPPLLWPRSN